MGAEGIKCQSSFTVNEESTPSLVWKSRCHSCSGTATIKKYGKALLGCMLWTQEYDGGHKQSVVWQWDSLDDSSLCTKPDISFFSHFHQYPTPPSSDKVLNSTDHSLPLLIRTYHSSCLDSMCRDLHGKQMFLSNAVSWMNVFRIGISINGTCPEEGLQGKQIADYIL